MQGKQLHYFTEGNTAKGFFSLRQTNICNLNMLYIASGSPDMGTAALLKGIFDFCIANNIPTEVIHNSLDSSFLSGIIMPEIKVGCFDDEAPVAVEDINGIKCICFGLPANVPKAQQIEKEAAPHKIKKAQYLDLAYKAFGNSLLIHDEWERIYIKNMCRKKANNIADTLLRKELAGKKANKLSASFHRFLGATTCSGVVEYIENLTADIEKRYFLKGRPGSGKSTILKKVAAAARQKGFDIEFYHCGLDPDSIDMVILRELSLSIFDSTQPHEHFPERKNDLIIDIYAEAIKPNTDEAYAEPLHDISTRYKQAVQEGISLLGKANIENKAIKSIFAHGANHELIKIETESIIKDITNRVNSI